MVERVCYLREVVMRGTIGGRPSLCAVLCKGYTIKLHVSSQSKVGQNVDLSIG